MKVKKILHITAVRELGSGQRYQLVYEVSASKKIPDIQWDTIAYHSGEIVEKFEKNTPKIFDFFILRNLFFWLMVLKLRKQYDIVLFRHVSFDPFSFIFSPFIRNRMGVHHAKEIDELRLVRAGLKGDIASFVEKYTGKTAVKNSLGIVGVTEEIALYENVERGLNKPMFLYPNGIEVDKISLAQDNRVENEYHIIFICSYFSEWHGLDILLKAIDNYDSNERYFVHLVGNLILDQKTEIEKNKNKEKIIVHGVLNQQQYLDIASKCDIGLGSLALYRKNLYEASTLKVREMLAMGLPVFSGHKDAALKTDFQYYKYSENFSFDELMQFAKLHKYSKRTEVREAAKKFIDKEKIMKKFISKIDF
ncbi:hypothetical protein [Acinetobacter pseudolwoffii]|uniref:hypothetical protein n=1 Tax=Acinetobacter pseudolwoffii TaxID=2053287 RepID=UPI000C247EC3|nr:hypothetical protein [Acinetobacter pseudolwoffii]PJI29646.1 hypothetical protein CU478_08010 [Acinetobacter pseudolwoffii]